MSRNGASGGAGGTLDVTAIVVSYNSEERIAAAVQSHEEALADYAAEVIVIDNASSDNSVEAARAALTRGVVVANTDNVGYGKAANQGIAMAQGRACLILNDDARVGREDIGILLEELQRSDDVALVGPRIVDEAENAMPSARAAFPGPGEEFQRVRDILRRVDSNYQYPAADDRPQDVAWLVGACLLGDTEVLRSVGAFNPAFFLYSEDIDLARRLHEQGYRVVTVPQARCVHTGSVSTEATFGTDASSKRRTQARDLYYRIWLSRPMRGLVHLRRAIGVKNQPGRLIHHLPKVIWDGPSMADLQNPPPIRAVDRS